MDLSPLRKYNGSSRMGFVDALDDTDFPVMAKSMNISPKKKLKKKTKHLPNKNAIFASYKHPYSDDENGEGYYLNENNHFDRFAKNHYNHKYVEHSDFYGANTSDEYDDTQLTRKDIEAILKTITPVAKQFKKEKLKRKNTKLNSPKLARDERLRYLKEDRYRQYDDNDLMFCSAYNYEKSLPRLKDNPYFDYEQHEASTDEFENTLTTMSPSKYRQHNNKSNAHKSFSTKSRNYKTSKTIFDEISDDEISDDDSMHESGKDNQRYDVFAMSQPNPLTRKLDFESMRDSELKTVKSVFSKSLPIQSSRNVELNSKKPITNVSQDTLDLIAKLSAHQQDLRKNKSSMDETILENETSLSSKQNIERAEEKQKSLDMLFEKADGKNVVAKRSSKESVDSRFLCNNGTTSSKKNLSHISDELKTPVKSSSSKYETPGELTFEKSPSSSPIRTSTIKNGLNQRNYFAQRKELNSPIRTSTMISRRLSPERLLSSTTPKYIPLPDQKSAISAAMAAKAKPILNIQSTRSVGEMDLSLSENARFIKPSVNKGRNSRQMDKDFESPSKNSLEKKWKLKVKQTSVQRSPTRNHDTYLAKLQEKPDFYQIIEENKKKEKQMESQVLPRNSFRVEYNALKLKKVPTKTIKSNKKYDNSPASSDGNFWKSRINPKGFDKDSTPESKNKEFKTPEEIQFRQIQKRLLSESPSKIENLGNKTIVHDDLPSDSIAVINKIRSRSPERLSAIEKNKLEDINNNKSVPDDAIKIINKIRSSSPEKLSAFEKNKFNALRSTKSLPDDAAEIINRIRSKSPERINEIEKSKLEGSKKSKTVPEDAAEIINKIRSKYI